MKTSEINNQSKLTMGRVKKILSFCGWDLIKVSLLNGDSVNSHKDYSYSTTVFCTLPTFKKMGTSEIKIAEVKNPLFKIYNQSKDSFKVSKVQTMKGLTFFLLAKKRKV